MIKNRFGFGTLILAATLMLVSGLAQAKFTSGMSRKQIAAEVSAQRRDGASLTDMVKESIDAGLNSAQVVEVMIMSGLNPLNVVRDFVTLNPNDAPAITRAAISAAPDQSKDIMAAVLTVPGVDPQNVLAATASGGESHAGGGNNSRSFVPVGTPPASGGGGQASPA